VGGKYPQQTGREGNSQKDAMPVFKNPEPRPNVIVSGKGAQVMLKVELKFGADAESGKHRGQKQQNVDPVTPLGRVYYNNPDLLSLGVKNLIFQRGRRILVRHGA
jgi:hypothetical protein